MGKKELRCKGPIVLPFLALSFFLYSLSPHCFLYVCFILHIYTYLTGTMRFSIIIPNIRYFK